MSSRQGIDKIHNFLLPSVPQLFWWFFCSYARPPSVRPSVRSFVRSFVRACVRACVRPSARSFVRSFVRPFVGPSVRPSVHSFLRPVCSFNRVSVRLSVRSSNRPSVRSFISCEWSPRLKYSTPLNFTFAFWIIGSSVPQLWARISWHCHGVKKPR